MAHRAARVARILGYGVVALGVFAACKSKPPSEIIVALQTDLALPKDIDKISVNVTSRGRVLFDKEYDVGPGLTRIPATLGIVADPDEPQAAVRLRVIGRLAGDPKLLRSAVTQVPPERTTLLRMPLQWLCWEQTTQEIDGGVTSTCPDGQTCISGACVDETVDPATLTEFAPASVFGGGDALGAGGACFDTLACLGAGTNAAVQASDCSIARPAGGAGINVGMARVPGRPGICSAQACFIPIDQDDTLGWKDVGGRIVLPKATCDRLALPATDDLSITGITVTTSCATKTAAVPTCGPWSSVGDAGGP